MMPDDFGAVPGSDAARFSEDEFVALEQLGARARGVMLKVLGAVVGRKLQIGEVRLHEITPEDLDISFRGGYLTAEAELTDPAGLSHACLTLLGKDELAVLFEMREVDEAAFEEQASRLGDVAGVIVDSLNLHWTANAPAGTSPAHLELVGIRQAELEGAGSITDLLGEADLVQVSYPLTDANGGEVLVSHLATMAFLRGLIRDVVPAEAEPAAGADDWSPASAAIGTSTFGDSVGAGPVGAGAPFAGLGDGAGSGGDSPIRPARFAEFGGVSDGVANSNISLILDVPLRITVELGRSIMSIRDILDLGPGSVVELDKLAGEPVDILVNDRAIAKGEVVVVEETFGVRITDIISPAKRVASFR